MINKLKNKLWQISQSVTGIFKDKYECPLCGYVGAFFDVNPPTGYRKNCNCPKCGSAERHRLQKLVCNRLFESFDPSNAKILHFAPEPFFTTYFKEKFKEYMSADLLMQNVDVKCDITQLPFEDNTKDYFERYQQYFSDVKVFTSSGFSERYQPFIYEAGNPLGEKRDDYVPVCFL